MADRQNPCQTTYEPTSRYLGRYREVRSQTALFYSDVVTIRVAFDGGTSCDNLSIENRLLQQACGCQWDREKFTQLLPAWDVLLLFLSQPTRP